MADKKDTLSYDAEKGGRISSDDVSGEPGMVHRGSVHEIMMAADLNDQRYETTHRGLKSRHAQMIALGGTIGTGCVASILNTTQLLIFQPLRRFRTGSRERWPSFHPRWLLHPNRPRLLRRHGHH